MEYKKMLEERSEEIKYAGEERDRVKNALNDEKTKYLKLVAAYQQLHQRS